MAKPEESRIEELLREIEELTKRSVASFENANDVEAVSQAYADHCAAFLAVAHKVVDEFEKLGDRTLMMRAKDRIMKRVEKVDRQSSVANAAIDSAKKLIGKSLGALPKRSRFVFIISRLEEWMELERKIIASGDATMIQAFGLSHTYPLSLLMLDEMHDLTQQLMQNDSNRWIQRVLEDEVERVKHLGELRESNVARINSLPQSEPLSFLSGGLNRPN